MVAIATSAYRAYAYISPAGAHTQCVYISEGDKAANEGAGGARCSNVARPFGFDQCVHMLSRPQAAVAVSKRDVVRKEVTLLAVSRNLAAEPTPGGALRTHLT